MRYRRSSILAHALAMPSISIRKSVRNTTASTRLLSLRCTRACFLRLQRLPCRHCLSHSPRSPKLPTIQRMSLEVKFPKCSHRASTSPEGDLSFESKRSGRISNTANGNAVRCENKQDRCLGQCECSTTTRPEQRSAWMNSTLIPSGFGDHRQFPFCMLQST